MSTFITEILNRNFGLGEIPTDLNHLFSNADMAESGTKPKLNMSWKPFLLKIILAIAGVYLIELAGRWTYQAAHPEPLSRALAPFQNNFFSFSAYYLTDSSFNFEFTRTPSATLRFEVYAIVAIFIYFLINIPLIFLPYIKKYAGEISKFLFYSIFALTFLLAFFLPDRKTVIDLGDKEIDVTRYSYWIISTTEHIPFKTVQRVYFDFVHDFDAYNHRFVYYLTLRVELSTGKNIRLGELEAGSVHGKWKDKPVWEAPAAIVSQGDEVVSLLKKSIGLLPEMK
jgi:hypothetical protein